MSNVIPAVLIVATIIKLTDLFTHLTKIGDAASRNAIVKSVVAIAAALGVILLAAQTTIAGGYPLHGILPVETGVTLGSLSFWDALFASMVFGLTGGSLVDIRKALDNTDSAAQPSIVG